MNNWELYTGLLGVGIEIGAFALALILFSYQRTEAYWHPLRFSCFITQLLGIAAGWYEVGRFLGGLLAVGDLGLHWAEIILCLSWSSLYLIMFALGIGYAIGHTKKEAPGSRSK